MHSEFVVMHIAIMRYDAVRRSTRKYADPPHNQPTSQFSDFLRKTDKKKSLN
jgi:hypothetical protein